MSGDLTKKNDVTSALTGAVEQIAKLRARSVRCHAAYDKWKVILAGARAMAEQVGCASDDRQNARQARAQEALLNLDAVSAAPTTTDFTSKESALASLARAAHVFDSASKLVSDASDAVEQSAARAQALRHLVVAAGTVSDEEAEGILLKAAKKAHLPPEVLGGETTPLAERPIVEIAVHLLQREGRPLRTHELIALMSNIGRPIDSSNPSATIRSAIMARRKKSPVVEAGPGRWRLREWPADVGEKK